MWVSGDNCHVYTASSVVTTFNKEDFYNTVTKIKNVKEFYEKINIILRIYYFWFEKVVTNDEW